MSRPQIRVLIHLLKIRTFMPFHLPGEFYQPRQRGLSDWHSEAAARPRNQKIGSP
jgi:hypothetical protein